MVARHGPAVLRVANQFSLCHDDALDAYQRALEIFLRRMDSVDPATEGAWLRVVVKHEAMAIRRARLDSVDRDDVDLDEKVHGNLRDIDDAVAGGERVDRSVDALRALKPDEARALLLKAEGLSYQEIGHRFGWSYTKVNRSVTEGRARFLKTFRGIEAGEACENHAAALSALAAGTATRDDVLSLRPHLRHCATCRASVRELRFSRTRRLALLLPFGWLARLLSRSDVGTTIWAASNGGGRLGPAAALVGLCLSGVGAGAACVMTGALPAPPIIEHVQSKPKPKTPKATDKPKRRSERRSASRPGRPSRSQSRRSPRRRPPRRRRARRGSASRPRSRASAPPRRRPSGARAARARASSASRARARAPRPRPPPRRSRAPPTHGGGTAAAAGAAAAGSPPPPPAKAAKGSEFGFEGG